MSLTLGSFFDGLGGWLVAAAHAGVTPKWRSEIDDFPAEVAGYHFPDVPNLGDITKIKAEELEPVDIICAGSPCQDLSVAGKRAGLKGERSGLFHTAIRLVHELRRRTGKPRYFVWENVPGAFSSNKGLDFRAILEEISRTEIPMPKDNRWAECGMVEWGEGSLAWRVLDAQYWGVPQRRKRIFLVADFAGQSAGEILFVEQGLHGHTSESEGEREGAAADASTGVESTGGRDPDSNHGGFAFFDMTHANNPVQSYNNKLCHTLTSRMGTGGNQVPVVHCLNDQGGSVMDVSDKAGTLRAQSHGHEPIVHTICGNIIGRENQNGGHQMGVGKDVSFTLNTVDRHAVASPKTVRRLTPLECERLQGLDDGYTDVEYKGKPAPDSKRYKAIGNGMAQPVADFIIRRIAEVNADELD